MTDPIEDICFPEGKEVALAAARAAAKPLLTTANLNALARDQEANKALAAQAIKDIPGFIRQHFYLTPAQDRQLNSLPQENIGEITKALQPIAAKGGSVQFGNPVANPDNSKEGSIDINGPLGIGFHVKYKVITGAP
jgi:hypothetical protein